jgi:uncharacterized membrane protein
VGSVADRERTTVLIHYYRAMVGRADTWRQRMDATTNWAIVANAALISFTLGTPAVPHWTLSIAVLMTLVFLVLEARRLCFYNLWQRRVLLLEEGLIRPALWGEGVSAPPCAGGYDEDSFRRELDEHLGRTVPAMRLRRAVARRLRRVYLYLIAIEVLAWVVKLASHPTAASDPAQIVERAAVGPVPGLVVCLCLGLALAGTSLFAAVLGRRDPRPDLRAGPASRAV